MKPKKPKSPKPKTSANACGLCGKTSKLTRTECCGQWICDDEGSYQMFSYARNSCSRNHRRYTVCGGHYAEGHDGDWQTCAECRDGYDKLEMYVSFATNEYNFVKLANPPAFEPTRCGKCKSVIQLGEEGFSIKGGEYFCERCTEMPKFR